MTLTRDRRPETLGPASPTVLRLVSSRFVSPQDLLAQVEWDQAQS